MCVVFLLFALKCRWSDPDNESVTAKVVSEVKAQFPHFAEGDIKSNYFLSAVVYTNSVYKCLILLASCKRYFQTLNQREKRKDKLTNDQVKQRRKQRKLRVSIKLSKCTQ